MESMDIKDLVIPSSGYEKHVNELLRRFELTINREIPRRQKANLRKLASLFLNDLKSYKNKPIVVNLDIGQGKSTLLLEFIKYIYEVLSQQ